MPEKKEHHWPHFSKREAIGFGYDVAKKNILFFLGIFVILIVVYSVAQLLQASVASSKDLALLALVFAIAYWILNVIVEMGTLNISLKFNDHKKPQFSDLFYLKSKNIVNYIIAGLIKGLIVLIGIILLIIPGIYFSLRLTFVGFLVVDKGLDPIAAIKKSWAMTKGTAWNLFLFYILTFLVNVLGFLLLIVGLIITIPLTLVAQGFVYRKILSQSASK